MYHQINQLMHAFYPWLLTQSTQTPATCCQNSPRKNMQNGNRTRRPIPERRVRFLLNSAKTGSPQAHPAHLMARILTPSHVFSFGRTSK